ncbi:MAG: ester cyclase [Solirubrobacteraceae bacterium]
MFSDATTGGDSPPAPTAPEDLAEASRRLLEQTFNDGKLELADQLIAADAVNHDPAEPVEFRGLRGPEALKRAVSLYRAAFPDVRMTVDDVIVAGDKVVLRWHSAGTHRGAFAGLAPTGVHGSVTGISIDQWRDGKVVEAWTEWDNLGLARQIGAAPPEGSFGEKLGMGVQRLMARWMRKKNQA